MTSSSGMLDQHSNDYDEDDGIEHHESQNWSNVGSKKYTYVADETAARKKTHLLSVIIDYLHMLVVLALCNDAALNWHYE